VDDPGAATIWSANATAPGCARGTGARPGRLGTTAAGSRGVSASARTAATCGRCSVASSGAGSGSARASYSRWPSQAVGRAQRGDHPPGRESALEGAAAGGPSPLAFPAAGPG